MCVCDCLLECLFTDAHIESAFQRSLQLWNCWMGNDAIDNDAHNVVRGNIGELIRGNMADCNPPPEST